MRNSFVRSLVITAGLLAIAFPLWSSVSAQRNAAPAAPESLINQPDNPALRGFKWRPIGPVGQGVRVDDFAVDEKNPTTFYVGFAVAGVIKTVNNGTTFTSIFDTYGASSIADIALAPSNPDILYVATGEANNRQTTSYGDGLYKSIDGGKSFTNVGFKDSQSLGRVLIHPKDPNIAWIAVGGHLYGGNTERGVFMTTDGGKTWTKTLYVDEYTSATEIIIDPSNPLNLWAAMYQRQRTAWGFVGGGPSSGIYNSIDGGKTWKKVTAPGLPKGTLGRVGMDFCKSQPNIMYAQIEAGLDKAPPAVPGPPAAAAPAANAAGAAGQGGGGGGGRGRGANQVPNPQYSGVFKSIDKGKTWTFQSNENQRPMYFSQIRVDPNNCETLYLGGVGPTKSIDSGKTWNGLNNMGHVDNHAIWVDPLNSKHVMYGNDGAVDVTWDGGEKWESLRNFTGGLAYHASADMRRPYHVCAGLQDNGSWCGPSSVRTGEIRQWMWQSVGGGDGFQNQIDRENPNIFYTESQNGSITRYNYDTGEQRSIRPNAGLGGRGGGGGGGGGLGRGNILNPIANANIAFNWNSPIRLSPFNTATLYLGGRSLYISRDRGDTWTTTKEMGKGINLDERSIMGVKYSTPICGYAPPEGAPTPPAGGGGGGRGGGGGGGGRTAGPGEPCILSKDDGYVPYEFGSMTEMAESPVLPGILWAGTDDGNIQVSRDGGNNWEEVGKNIPGVNHEYYVSGIETSWYDAATTYVALDGHRNNDLKPYIFKTTDYGKTWTSVSGNLPAIGNVNSIRQDPVNKNLLFAPTELGFYISLNDGKTWSRFMPNLPIGRTDEVLVHPREHDLILATHSRAVWIMDDITSLENMTDEQASKDAALFPVRDAIVWKQDRRLGTEVPGDKWWGGENAPRGTAIAFNVKSGGDAKLTITDTATGQEFRTESMAAQAGLNRWQWNLCSTPIATPQQGGRGGGGGGGNGFGGGCQGGGRAATPGVYKLSVSVGGKEIGTQVIRVLEDIWLNEK